MQGLGAQDPPRLGPYRLRAVVGDGGMGRVYPGTSEAGRLVAVKVIGPGLAGEPGYRQRFAREARAAMSVSGLYTASVVDVFSLACVLVYAARGAGPYGNGDRLVVVHRTVSQPPDLAGTPEPIRALVQPLLDQDPTLRPTPAQVLRQISQTAGTAVLHDALWLPDGVRTLLDQRRVEVQRVLGEQRGPIADPAATVLEPASGAYGASGRAVEPTHSALNPTPFLDMGTDSHSGARGRDRPTGWVFAVSAASAALIVIGIVVAVIVFWHDGLSDNASNDGPLSTGSRKKSQTVTHAATGSTWATEEASSAPTSSSAGPRIYPVDRLIATDTLGDTETVQSVIVNADGAVQVKLVDRAAVDGEWTCAYSKAGEMTLSTVNGTSESSTGSDCTGDPTKIWVMTAGELWTNTEYFPHAPTGSGPWTITALQRAYQGQLSGVDIPAATS